MAKNIQVQKRNGQMVPYDVEKIHKSLNYCVQGLDVSMSEVELSANLAIHDGMKTTDIHAALIKAAANLISVEKPDYEYLAARLLLINIRKSAYGRYEPITIKEQIEKHKDLYNPILQTYSDEELDYLEYRIDHDRDYLYKYAGMEQFMSKYLMQNRAANDGSVYESPQMAGMLIAMTGFAKLPKEDRIEAIVKFYEYWSRLMISLPTPIMSGVRTRINQAASCVKIEVDDNLDSIGAANNAIIDYISRRAGIGLNVGRIRGRDMPIRNGDTKHTGLVPFLRMFQSAVLSCSQGGVRGGAATLFYPLWHLDCEELLVLKNNMGADDVRVRHVDYGVQINGFLWKRILQNGKITLFSPNQVPDLYDAFFQDQKKFEELYVKYENDPSIVKKTVSALNLAITMFKERAGSGRIYIMNVDNVNNHSPFDPLLAPVRQSNLCMEIAIPTEPITRPSKENPEGTGEIALCVLSAINPSVLNHLHELEGVMNVLVEFLDELITNQEYPSKAAEISTRNRRSLGIGIINYANYLAKKGYSHLDPEAIAVTDELCEYLQYYALKASIRLAKRKGACEWFNQTTYARAILPIDRYKKSVDKVCDRELSLDWESLRNDLREYGLRNSTLTSFMPSETSSQIAGATNGIEPIRSLVVAKKSRDGVFKQLAPDVLDLGLIYQTQWHPKTNECFRKLVAVMQKWVDQSISYNEYYDPDNYPDGNIPVMELIKNAYSAHQLGIKTMYYHNTRQVGEEPQEDLSGCAGGACTI